MKYLIAAVLAAVSLNAHAMDYEISAGRTNFTKQEDGIWYQKYFPNTVDLTSSSLAMGLTGKVNNWRWRAGAEYLGGVTSSARCIPVDAIYYKYGAASTKHFELISVYGSGSVNMLYFTVAPEFEAGSVVVSPEVGLNIYRSTWTTQNVVDPQSHLQGSTMKHKAVVDFTPSVGLSIGYKNVSVAATYIYRTDAAGDGYPAIFHDHAVNVSARYRF